MAPVAWRHVPEHSFLRAASESRIPHNIVRFSLPLVTAMTACEPVERPLLPAPLGQAVSIEQISAEEMAYLRSVAQAGYDSAAARNARSAAQDLRKGGTVPPLNLRTIGDPGPMERRAGGRVTFSEGLDYLGEELRRYTRYSVVQSCASRFRQDTAYMAAESRAYRSQIYDLDAWRAARELPETLSVDLCDAAAAADTATSGTGVGPDVRRRLIDTYMARRQAELRLVSSRLRRQIGLGSVISADEERAVQYLDRLASRVGESDGALGAEILDAAERAVAWRDARVEAGAITRDLQQELSMRKVFADREATFRRNRELSARIAASKSTRTAAQRDSARQAVCSSFGIAPGECPP